MVVEAAFRDYIDGNTIDDIVGAGENFVYGDVYPKLSGVLARNGLYEALAGSSEGFEDESIDIFMNGDAFRSHERHGNIVIGWVEGMRGANISIFGYDEAAKEYIDELRKSAEEAGITYFED